MMMLKSTDEAWYKVRLVLEGETLTVKSCNREERFTPANFKDVKDAVDGFASKFRLASAPLQDNECQKISEGMFVCASYVFSKDDVRFYDAYVVKANFKDHKPGHKCTCTFLLHWLFGPNGGIKTEAVVTNICIRQQENAQMDPALSSFMEICRARHNIVTTGPAHVSGGDCTKVHNANKDSFINNNTRPPQFAPPVRSTIEVKNSVSAAGTTKVQSTDHLSPTGEDMDLGGRSLLDEFAEATSFHYLLIDNLEKDVSPSAIMDFVRRHLSINCKAQVFPSLLSESYTKGIIMVDNQVALQKLSDFLSDPSHMILSSKGRPWVMTKKTIWCGASGATTANLSMLSERNQWDKSPEVGDKLRVVRSGTKEYESGKKMRDLFLEFMNHQQGLHHRLTMEESKILQSTGTHITV